MSRNEKHESEWRIIHESDTLPNIESLTLNDMFGKSEVTDTDTKSVTNTNTTTITNGKRVYDRSEYAKKVDIIHAIINSEACDNMFDRIEKILTSADYANTCMTEARRIAYSACKRMYANGKGAHSEMLRELMNSMIRDMRTLDIDPSYAMSKNITKPISRGYSPETSARATSDELQTWNPDENKKATTKSKARKTWDETISDGFDIVTEAYTVLYDCARNGMSYESARRMAYRAVHRYVNGERSYNMRSVAMDYINDEGDEVSKNIAVSYDVYAKVEEMDIRAIMDRLALTKRETEIVSLMVFRSMNADRIAARLNVSMSTVYNHVNAIRKHVARVMDSTINLYRVRHSSKMTRKEYELQELDRLIQWHCDMGINAVSTYTAGHARTVPCGASRYWIDAHDLHLKRIVRPRSYARYSRIK